MLINLVPEFLDLLGSRNPEDAYRRYFEAHRPVLSAFWRNYLLDPDSPPAHDLVRVALRADRTDLRDVLNRVPVVSVLEEALARAQDRLRIDRSIDCYLIVGMGSINAGELVVDGRGVVFLCLEHFTGSANPETLGMGLAPDRLPVWLGHGLAHSVRYTSPTSRSELRRVVEEEHGYYDYWSTGSRIPLRELLLNEGLAVLAAEVVTPGFGQAEYLGYTRRQYQRLRELEAFLRQAAESDLDDHGLGLRLRWLSRGMSPAARLVLDRVIPERAGYYLGHRMAEPLASRIGIADALRAAPNEFREAEDTVRGVRSAQPVSRTAS